MGAWGIGNFDNDGAMNWFVEFLEDPSVESLHEIFKNVGVDSGSVETDDGSKVVAAAEVILSANGKKSKWYPKGAREFIELTINGELIYDALVAIDIICESEVSELKQLWKESDQYYSWKINVEELKQKLESILENMG